jgi:hypothetical protein
VPVTRLIARTYHPHRYSNTTIRYSETDEWYYIFGDPIEIQCGWKLYIPYALRHADLVLSIAVPLLLRSGLNFKYVKSRDAFLELDRGQFGYSQIGKCLVVYMPVPDEDVIVSLITELRGVITSYPTPPYLAKLSSDPPIFYRFGEYRPIKEKTTPNPALGERYIKESRSFPLSIFAEAPKIELRSDIDRLLLKYPVVDVIRQRGKGGVFIAIDMSSEHYGEVILKAGYSHGEENDSGMDGLQLIKNEESILRLLGNDPLKNVVTPDLIASAQGRSSYALVQQKCVGENARQLLSKGILNQENIRTVISGISELGSKGIIWGDAKIDNVFVDISSGTVSFIDFETATHAVNYDNTHNFKSFHIISHSIEAEKWDAMCFLVSVLFDPKNDDQKRIDLNILISRGYSDQIPNYCQNLLRGCLETPTVELEDRLDGRGT